MGSSKKRDCKVMQREQHYSVALWVILNGSGKIMQRDTRRLLQVTDMFILLCVDGVMGTCMCPNLSNYMCYILAGFFFLI